jgi:nucleotide-binding universal stress UspA family protein
MHQVSRTVVVGVDGTHDGLRAVDYAIELARREHAGIRLVHVVQQSAMFAPMLPYLPESTLQEVGGEVLEAARTHVRESGFDAERTEAVLENAPRIPTLLQHSRDVRCIVLGTRSSMTEHLFTGSTSLSVAAHAVVPVHCVPRSWSRDAEAVHDVAAGLDGSSADLSVMEQAFTEAEARSASVTFVHAWRPVSPYDSAIMRRTLRAEWEQAAREALTKEIGEVAGRHDGVSWHLVLDYDRVPLALHQVASEADVVVVGRHGRRLPAGLAIGSNTRTLLRTATCPVVVVPVVPTHE